jgi:hypothetical protein
MARTPGLKPTRPPATDGAASILQGRYVLHETIGRGSLATVYRATDTTLDRAVAVKLLHPHLCRDTPFVEQFLDMERRMARLFHPNLVTIFDAGADDDQCFVVMEYVAGPDLAVRVRERGPLGPDEAARVGADIATALSAAHRKGILHRDVKPQNILLDPDGRARLTDFGSAKLDGQLGVTGSGTLAGTLAYTAPEVLAGRRGDARADVYALGLTLYEALTLQSAYDESDRLRLMDRIAHGSPAPLRQTDPRVPRDLETVVGKAMAREPRDRYTTAGELAADLERFLADRPIRARRAGPLELTWRWARRRPGVAALAAAVVVLLAVTAGGGWWVATRLRDKVETATRAERDTTDRLWEARLSQARAGRASRQPGQRFRSLEAIAEAAGIRPSRELRNEAIACLALTDLRLARHWTEELETDRLEYSTGAAFDADLAHYAVSDAAGTVRVCAAEDGRELARLVGPAG